MSTNHPTRRDFLLKGGLAFGSLAAASKLRPQNPGHQLRGLMVDAGRTPESLSYYRRVIDFCAEWEFNALQFRLADDQGCAIRFSSAPGLLYHKNAFAPEQLSELAHYSRRHGVDLIPELESFGHTGYITRSAAYAHLLDVDSQTSSEFTGVIPVHPETLELFRKLYKEVSAIFPSNFLHGGCDEVKWGGSQLSRKALLTKPRYQIWAEYLNSLNRIAEDLGKQFIVWGDFVLHKEPRILAQLSKRIVVMDWDYSETDPAKVGEVLSTIRGNGSRGIGAPALINYKWGPRAGREQLANIDAFADAYLAAQNDSSLGVMLTNWVPSRYIQNSIWDGFAYAAVAFKEGSKTAQNSAFRRFVETRYRAHWNNDWDEAFRLIYASAPEIERESKANPSSDFVPLHVPFSSDEQLQAVLRKPSLPHNPFTRLRSLLAQLQAQVLKNLADFRAFELSVSYMEQLYWRETVVVDHAATKSLSREDAALAIKNVAERDHAMATALSKDWDQGRFADSPAKLKPLYGIQPKDQLVFQFQRAADYSASLASHPDHFFELLASTNPGDL
jgi:hypothetical protein